MSPGDNKQPSAIANKIIERLGESGLNYRLPAPTSLSKPSHQNLASAVIAATAFKAPKLRRRSESILDPANREFLLKQGQDENARKNKKLILGMHTFSLNPEGDLIQHAGDPSGKIYLGQPMSPQSLRWKQTFKQMDSVSTVKEAEEIRDVFDTRSDNDVRSIQEDSEVLSHESCVGSSFIRRKQLIRQMRFEEEETRKSVDKNVLEIFKSETIIEHLGVQASSSLIPKDSFELEEVSFEDETQLAAEQPSASVEIISMSESSGFAEEGHSIPATSELNPMKVANKRTSFQVPPVEVTFWDSWDNGNSGHSPTYRGRLSDPNIMCLSPESPDLQTDDNPAHRKGSFPQPSPKRWSPTHCNFLWPSSERLKASSPLSSSETTITNEMGNDIGQSGSEALSEGKLRVSVDVDGRCHSPYYQPDEAAGSTHSDQSVASSPNDLLDLIAFDNPSSILCTRSVSLTPQESPPHSGKYRRSQSYPVSKEIYSVLAQQQAFLEIQSLHLALEQYKSQGQRLESCSRRFLNYYPLLTEDQRKSLEYVQQLKTEVYREIGHMEAMLNQHSKSLQSKKTMAEDTSPKLQRALHQMRELLQEQSDLQNQLEKFALSDSAPAEIQSSLVPSADSRTVLLMEAVSEELMLFRRQLKADQETMKTELQDMLVKTKEEILGSVKEWMSNSKKDHSD